VIFITVQIRYAIAIFNNEEEYIIKPFLSNPPKVSKLILICNKNSEHEESKERIVDFLNMINVTAEFIYVDDITNFFQTFFTVRGLCMREGPPSWVNISCGSGIGMAALAVHAVKNNISVVAYESNKDKTVIVNLKKLQKINIFDQRYFKLMEDLANGKDTIKQLAESNRIDKSTVSRRLRGLYSMEVINKMSDERRSRPYKFALSEFGKSLLMKV